ncbi:hypothetical protein FE634_04240 [Nocardioides dongxiaopingii]|uniref:DUF6174 domain-containing protein n=1 Tax=Nocardioides sp. S-1144 TaxID=2582905 RepID=UPI00110F4776|nr:DUF6174 domain-containing protein [Nocardioides sp. S-1144]QCW49817.1 hypothetical protein FE634_04240 [Nocardioides sp. S-1144]
MLRHVITTLTVAATTAVATLALVVPAGAEPTGAGPAGADTAGTSTAAGSDPRARAPYRITPFRPTADDDRRLVRAWRTWASRDDHERYTTVLRTACFCGPDPIKDVVTVVRGRRVTSVTHAGRSRELARHGYEMDAVYQLLREFYATADEVVVRYRNGVPRRIAVDRIAGAVDDEVYHAVAVRLRP